LRAFLQLALHKINDQKQKKETYADYNDPKKWASTFPLCPPNKKASFSLAGWAGLPRSKSPKKGYFLTGLPATWISRGCNHAAPPGVKFQALHFTS